MAPIFNITEAKNIKVSEFYDEAINELNQFYEIRWSGSIPKIYLVPDRKTFDNLKGYKTEDWVVGSTLNSRDIFYVLSPDNYEAESNHKYSDGEYSRLIKHELSHLFQKQLFDSYKPVWLTEGLAVYTSGQLEVKKKPVKFTKFLSFFSQGGSGVYDESGFAVDILIKKFGKKKFLNVLKKIEVPFTKETFYKYFEKELGIKLNYSWFNKNL